MKMESMPLLACLTHGLAEFTQIPTGFHLFTVIDNWLFYYQKQVGCDVIGSVGSPTGCG